MKQCHQTQRIPPLSAQSNLCCYLPVFCLDFWQVDISHSLLYNSKVSMSGMDGFLAVSRTLNCLETRPRPITQRALPHKSPPAWASVTGVAKHPGGNCAYVYSRIVPLYVFDSFMALLMYPRRNVFVRPVCCVGLNRECFSCDLVILNCLACSPSCLITMQTDMYPCSTKYDDSYSTLDIFLNQDSRQFESRQRLVNNPRICGELNELLFRLEIQSALCNR